MPFEDATSAASVYASMSALVIHLGLAKPSENAEPKRETILIWGGSSSVGTYAVQIASKVRTPATISDGYYVGMLNFCRPATG
jgi:NADPH:quinone reductase-like Zn-dependent oxidoreductase